MTESERQPTDPFPLQVRRAAVLGAGVMGAQIAALLAAAGIDTLLFELAAEGDDPRANARRAIDGLARLKPPPLASATVARRIRPATYDPDLDRLAGCDLVIEAVAERMDIKQGLYAQVGPALGPDTVFATNTSGLSVGTLSTALPEEVRARFAGVHFFNPPRYMRLVELIPTRHTAPGLLDALETWLVTNLGKGVVRAKDTPNFIANRIGAFSLLATLHHAERLGLGFDVVDALTGPLIGRPKSATFRTLDVVGLDTMAHVVEGIAPALREAGDPWVEHYRLPEWLHALIRSGALGQKTRRGIYRKTDSGIEVFDPARGDYRPSEASVDPEVKAALDNPDPAARLQALAASTRPQAQLLWAIHRDTWHYAAYLLESIADSAREVDLALRWGYGWAQGPFEAWQAAGWQGVAELVRADIDAGRAMASVALPEWVGRIDAVHTPQGSWSPALGDYRPRSKLPVYRRQLWPELLLGEGTPALGETLFETDDARCLRVDDVAVLSFSARNHPIGSGVLEAVNDALDLAEADFRALVLWHPEPPFSVGANLKEFVGAVMSGRYELIDAAIETFQKTTARLRYSTVPVVAAAQGMALGGGCEFLLHCDRVVAALESYIGLVEAGVGLVPAGGGCKELARRIAVQARGADLFPFLREHFERVAMAKVSASALEAREWGLLREADPVIFNDRELLHVALHQARALAEANYRPPVPMPVRVGGASAIATIEAQLVNLREGGFISAHDYRVARYIAEALCGGEVDAGSEVSEEWLLALERKAFAALCRDPLTHARIQHTLTTGKPLRN